MIAHGRVLRRASHAPSNEKAVRYQPVPPAPYSPALGRVLKRSHVEARAQADRIVDEARARARQIVAESEREAVAVRREAYDQAHQQAAVELAIAWTRVRAEDASHDAREVERTVGLARAMAERLLGESLSLEPERIRAIAQQALAMVRQAQSVHLFAHPDDAEVLQAEIGALGLEPSVLWIHADAERPRGSLLLRTDLGTLDADLSLQLDRLVAALRSNFSR